MFKKIKYGIFGLGAVALIVSTVIVTHKFDTHTEKAETKTTIEQKKVVSKKAVISELKDNFQIVSKSAKVEKTYGYDDTKWYGKKSLTYTLKGKAKFGFNIDDLIQKEFEITSNNDVVLELPKSTLISLELPYDKMKIHKEKAPWRKDFTEADRQLIYKEGSKLAKQEVLNDTEVQESVNEANKEAIKKVLMKVPNVNSVIFK